MTTIEEDLLPDLDEWVMAGSQLENRTKAARIIRKSFNNKSTSLALSYLELTSLPESLSQLKKLKKLDLQGNRLTLLPAEFFSLSAGCEIYLSHNHFSSQAIEQTQQRARESNLRINISTYEGLRSSYTFSEVLENLQKDSKNNKELSFNFTNPEKNILTAFFGHLQYSSIYRVPYKKFTAEFLIKCLNFTQDNDEFKNICFANLEEASGTCGDRASLSLNNLFFQYYLTTKTWPK